jgi:hypothetical protein
MAAYLVFVDFTSMQKMCGEGSLSLTSGGGVGRENARGGKKCATRDQCAKVGRGNAKISSVNVQVINRPSKDPL